MKCPVCNHESTKNVCPICGYNLENDLLNSRYLNKLNKQEIEDYKEQISIHRKLYLKSIEKPKEANITPPVNKIYTQQQKSIAQQYFEKATDSYSKKDYESARKFFEISADNGKGLSYFYLGIIYKYGLGVESDLYKSFNYYSKAMKMGIDIAYKSVAEMYFLGEGVPADVKKGLEIFDKAIHSTDHWALYELGKKYYYGSGVLKQDYKKARECFEKDIKRTNGVSLSYDMLANIYEQGLGVSKNPTLAKQYRIKYNELTKRN